MVEARGIMILDLELKNRWAKQVEERHVDWTFDVLTALYSDTRRHYHNFRHVAWCLQALDEMAESEPEMSRKAAELALWLHDAVYVPGDKRNERLSVELLRAFAPVLTLPGGAINLAEAAIHATQRHIADSDSITVMVVVDIDMAILGAHPSVYDDYVTKIRKEFVFVSDEAWRHGRSSFLEQTLSMKKIFSTAWGQQFEEYARENMQRELTALRDR